MLNKSILFFILLYSINSTKGQNLPTTTEEEYNFCINGYKSMISNGYDMKKGYYFDFFTLIQSREYSFEMKILMREKAKEPAAILIIVKSILHSREEYICIPIGNYKFGIIDENYSDWDKNFHVFYTNALKSSLGTALDYISYNKKNIK